MAMERVVSGTRSHLLVTPSPVTGESVPGFVLRVTRLNHVPATTLRSRTEALFHERVAVDNLYCLDARRTAWLAQLVSRTPGMVASLTLPWRARRWRLPCAEGDALQSVYSVGTAVRYCPKCYHARVDHLNWWAVLGAVVCVVHRVMLANQCPRCGRYVLFDTLARGYCLCGEPLGAAGTAAPRALLAAQGALFRAVELRLSSPEVGLSVPCFITLHGELRRIILTAIGYGWMPQRLPELPGVSRDNDRPPAHPHRGAKRSMWEDAMIELLIHEALSQSPAGWVRLLAMINSMPMRENFNEVALSRIRKVLGEMGRGAAPLQSLTDSFLRHRTRQYVTRLHRHHRVAAPAAAH